MSTAKKNAATIMRHTDVRVRLGDDLDTAVEYAVDQTYRMRSEDARSDIYAFIRETFDLYPNGTPRRIGLIAKLRAYEISRIYG